MASTFTFSTDTSFPGKDLVWDVICKMIVGAELNSEEATVSQRAARFYHHLRSGFDWAVPDLLDIWDKVYVLYYAEAFKTTFGPLTRSEAWVTYAKKLVEATEMYLKTSTLPRSAASRLLWFLLATKEHGFLPFPTSSAMQDAADMFKACRTGIAEVSFHALASDISLTKSKTLNVGWNCRLLTGSVFLS